ncbi:MAG: hypothetical protein ACF788_00175 [Novipirellula sp. JB048]
MKRFHVYLYGADGNALRSSFEQAASRLERLPKLYFEADGSFVWCPAAAEQVDGMLYDAHGRLQYVDLQGQCSLETWKRLMAAIVGGPAEDCVVMVIPTRELKNLPIFEQSTWYV